MKDEIIRELRANPSEYVSGETLSAKLKVSRTAIWKCIVNLRQEGYNIEASPKRGYRLLEVPDILNEFEIAYNLKTGTVGRKIVFLKTVDSTNTCAKKLAQDGCPEGTVVVAEEQTAGKGRLGRQWNSREGEGIWMSVVLRPEIPPEDVQIITLAASVAVVSALKKVCGISAGIKWPNDIILDGKKVCGILTEMISEIERVNFIILGIGMNVNQKQEDFPPDIRHKAISLKTWLDGQNMYAKKIKRSDIIKGILEDLESCCTEILRGRKCSIIERWREYSVTLGREVKVIGSGYSYTGTAQDVDEDGALLVRLEDGSLKRVLSGEVSVRGVMDYI